jgi:hypothetical protein
VIDPADPGIAAIPANLAVQRMYAGSTGILAGGGAAAAGPTGGGGAPAVLLASSWWSSTYKGLESCMSSRGGMLRMGVIGMLIALVLIMFGHKWSK